MQQARHPIAPVATSTEGKRTVICCHCSAPLVIGLWERWNGFLVECSACHRFHGKPWSIRTIAWASFLLNGASFFFTMRPGNAFFASSFWFGLVWLTAALAESWPSSLEVPSFLAFFFGPIFINMFVLDRHLSDLRSGVGSSTVA